jgi:hypothetical protein
VCDRPARVTVTGMRASIEAHLGSQQVAKVVYGSIIGLALVVALAGHPPSSAAMIASLLGTAVAVGLAEMYSEIVGAETSSRRSVTRHEVAHMVDDALAVAFGIAFPAIFFLVALLSFISMDTAFTLAKWSGLALIGFYGYWAARFAGAPVHLALLRASLVALVGGALIVLKSLLH